MAEEVPPRPRVLAYPTPTSVHLLVLVLAVVAGGLFVGSWSYNIVAGRHWATTVSACFGDAPADPFAAEAAYTACISGVERERALASVGGAVVVVLIALVMLVALPAVVTRRRRLRPLPGALAVAQERVDALAQAAGVRRAPVLLVGRLSQRDAFTFGLPGRYRVALPPKLATRHGDPALFDPVMRHELAHVRHHDVTLAWFARTIWWAYWPVLVVPGVVSIARRDLGVLVPYLWRAALVLTVVRLVTAALLRAREHDADLAAAAGGTLPALRDLLAGSTAAPRPSRRRLLAQHPTVAERRAVLEHPARLARSSGVDALTAAFLAGTAFPAVASVANAALTGTGRDDLARVVAAFVVGAPLGVVLALGQWRAALFGRLGGPGARIGLPALATGLGLAVGGVVDPVLLAGAPAGALHPQHMVLSVLVGTGVVVLVTGLGELWAQAAPRVRRARLHWGAAALTGAVLMAGATWLLDLGAFATEQIDWPFGLTALTVSGSGVLAAGAALLAAAAAVPFVLRRGTPQAVAPRWVLEAGAGPPWPRPGGPRLRTVAAATLGAAACAVIVGALLHGSPSTADEAWPWTQSYLLAAEVAGAATVLALAVVAGAPGAGAALVAAPVAALLASGGLLLVASDVLGHATPVRWLARDAAALGLLLGLLVAGVGAVPRPRQGARRARLGLLAPVLAASCAVLVAGASVALVVQGRDRLFGAGVAAGASTGATPGPDGSSTPELVYAQVTAPSLASRFVRLSDRTSAIDADQTLSVAERAGRVRADVLPVVAELEDAVAPDPGGPAELQQIHAHARSAVVLFEQGLTAYAAALDAGDADAVSAAVGVVGQGAAERDTWTTLVVELRKKVGG
ncbi:MAG: M48 family metalloprotease [Brevundimonas sp.]